jgi:two-component system invasion response regulator UvrY
MSRSGATVLIVDDNSLIRGMLRTFLERNSELNVCGEAADGVDAVEKANVLKPRLILMDLAMPRMNGLQAAVAIKRAMPEARIVMFTLHSEAVGKLTEHNSGVDLVVSKSDGLDGLLRALQVYLRKDDSQAVH